MRALVLRDFGDLAVEDRPDPVPGPGELVVAVTATGICGSDIHGFTGENGRRKPGQVMGHETVGRVRALGPGVTGPSPGTAVAVNPVIGCGSCRSCAAGHEQACQNGRVIGVAPEVSAAFAELMAVPAGNAIQLPPGMPEEHGALVEPLSVGYHAARRGGDLAGRRVLVIGGGAIGQACVLAATRLGADAVAVSEIDPHRRALLSRLGAMPLDPADGRLAEQAATALGGPAAVVIDAVGSSSSLADALASSATGGSIVLVGMDMPVLDLPAYTVSTGERSVIGSFCYSASEFRDTARWAGSVSGRLAGLVDGRVSLEEAPATFRALAGRRGGASKVLVFPSGLHERAVA